MSFDRTKRITGWIAVGVVAAVAMGFLFGIVVMWLWNWLMPQIFGLPAINYWQAVGILILCHLLFKGHGHGHPGAHEKGHVPMDRFRTRVKSMLDHEDRGNAPEGADNAPEGAGNAPQGAGDGA
jgi:hypothetical protein